MAAYYNEHDGFKAEWLRHLIAKGVIAKGEVDERDIRKVQPGDLAGFAQCHFFAGVGVWSYALRLAGWPDDRPVWTGSCPCPGFSAAGKGGGFSDPRHLWPDWFRLIRERRPANLFGEQADDAVGFGWLDLVQTDLEAADYAVGKAVFGACSVGAPHIRQRLYFGAHAHGAELFREPSAGNESPDRRNGKAIRARTHSECDDGRADEPQRGPQRRIADRRDVQSAGAHSAESRRPDAREHGRGPSPLPARSAERDGAGGRTDAERRRREQRDEGQRPVSESDAHVQADGRGDTEQPRLERYAGNGDGSDQPGRHETGTPRSTGATGSPDGSGDAASRGFREHGSAPRHAGHADQSNPLAGFWRDAIWLPCRDGKYRPTQPGLFPLAHGAPARVGRLRGYGDAIVAQQAQTFIEAFTERDN